MPVDKKHFTALRSILRRAWLRWPSRAEALVLARREYKGDNKRQKWEYCCAVCNAWFKGTEVQVDHLKACGSLLKKSDLAGFVLRLFCIVDGLQVLCKPCHKLKTNRERAEK